MKSLALILSPLAAAALPAVAGLAEPAGISDALRPAGETPAFVLKAAGFQIYTCKASADGYDHKWTFVAPDAALSENGAVVGHHGAGPTWDFTGDASVVKGSAKARQDGGAGNIPWLWLPTSSVGKPGRFADVSSVLRVATQGGVEPTGGCDASHAGQDVKVPYTADYYFYTKG